MKSRPSRGSVTHVLSAWRLVYTAHHEALGYCEWRLIGGAINDSFWPATVAGRYISTDRASSMSAFLERSG